LITADALRTRFAGTRLPEDPLEVAEPPGLHRWPRKMRALLEVPLTPAGVLVPVVERSSGLSVLLTQRAAHLRAHAAQASFPGGRMEAQDSDVGATALRETFEEIGIEPHRVEVIGCLSTLPTITGFAVTPIVGLLDGVPELTIDEAEVEYTFELPLDFLLDDRNDQLVDRDWEGRRFQIREFHYDGERVWGATAYMLQAFRQFVLKQ
jgi:8-oxo-dGTP pyrophosphatase MutT (NUDIX family)